jgi:hypothetical protein
MNPTNSFARTQTELHRYEQASFHPSVSARARCRIEAGVVCRAAEEAGEGLWRAWERFDYYLLGEYQGGLEFWDGQGALLDG